MARWIRRTLTLTHADPDQRADLEQCPSDAAATGPGELAEGQANPTQRTEPHVGKRGEPQAHLIGRHGGRHGAVSEQVQLAFLDPVLCLSATTIGFLVDETA